MAPEVEHLLSSVQRLWQEMRTEFQKVPAADAELADDGEGAVPVDEMKKIAKWLQHGITKFGASASVAEGEEITQGLKPIAAEVIKSFTAAIGTLLSLKRGAGAVLLAELYTTGDSLASALDELGKAVGTPAMAVNAGKVLDKVKQFERTSTKNRAAIRRRLLLNLSQVRDAHRELKEAVASGDGDGDGDDDDDFFDGFDAALEPCERLLLEALGELAGACVEVLKAVSTACMPPKDGSGDALAVRTLEAAVVHSTAAASAVDGLAVASQGGLDAEEFHKNVSQMRGAVTGLLACPAVSGGPDLEKCLASLEAAFAAAVAEEEEEGDGDEK